MMTSVKLLGDDDATCGPLATTAGLGLAGFFFPLLKPMLRMGGQPAIRQQCLNPSLEQHPTMLCPLAC
jgi:hypothetical protein